MRYLKHDEVLSHSPCKEQYRRWRRLFPRKDYPKGMPMTKKNLLKMAASGIEMGSFGWIAAEILHCHIQDGHCSACDAYLGGCANNKLCPSLKKVRIAVATALYEANKEAKK